MKILHRPQMHAAKQVEISDVSTAKQVVKDCHFCKVRSQTLCQQRMGDLPKQMFDVPTSPFTNITMDYCAPMKVKSMTNARSTMKCWPIVICCLNTGALHIMLAEAYSTKAFLNVFDGYMAIRGQPAFIYTDSGSQLKSAKYNVLAKESQGVDWSRVAVKTSHRKIEWRVAPPEAQWRDGRSERAVAALKKTLKHLQPDHAMLNFSELQTLLHRAADCINERPLGVHHHGGEEPKYAPITPNLLLKGSRTQSLTVDLERYLDEDQRYVYRLVHMENLFQLWWQSWFVNVFDSLVPYPKWRKQHKNLEVGDICLVKYQGKIPPAEFRLCRVTKVMQDSYGLVRTVEISMRPRNIRESGLPYKSKQLITMTVPVQRLVLILSQSEEEARQTSSSNQVSSLNAKQWAVYCCKD